MRGGGVCNISVINRFSFSIHSILAHSVMPSNTERLSLFKKKKNVWNKSVTKRVFLLLLFLFNAERPRCSN